MPTLELELAAGRDHGGKIAGVDEAGRGPWAGPVVAAAVILDPHAIPHGIDDSKRLSPQARERLYGEILASASTGIGIAEVDRIDRDNILAATLWAMQRAVEALGRTPAAVLVDGNRPPALACPVVTAVGGDRLSLSIAAASIIAKVTRDRIMTELANIHPGYGFQSNKGYGTPDHRAALLRLGPAPPHRRSFAPIRDLLARGRAPDLPPGRGRRETANKS
ncbi:MAG: ribonuclease HII [Hyphomicrobiaceae bacterium]